MKEISVDVAIIGAGTAGLAARSAACEAGASTLLIEAGPGGTTCARVGCMPSKLLIAAARRAHAIEGAGLFGIESRGCRVDGKAVMARLRSERDRFVQGVLDKVAKIPDGEKLAGRARFLDGRTLQVDDHTRVAARAIVIATGAEPVVPGPFKDLGERLLTNESLFELEELPESVGVLGVGPLGLELGQALHRLGVRTVLFDKGESLGGLSDEKVNAAARRALEAELDLRLGIEAAPAGGNGKGVTLRWEGGEESFDQVLAAMGRKPNLEGLELEKAELELDDHGTPLFDARTRRCGESAVFIAGDAGHDRPVLHEAAWEGRLAGHNAAAINEKLAEEDRLPAFSLVFSEPQLATLGEADPDDAGIAVGEADYSDQGRARAEGENAGLLRLYADKESGRLAGAAMAIPGAEHIATLLAWALGRGMTASELLNLPYYHPTLEEGLRTAVHDLCCNLGVRARPGAEALREGPGG